MSVTDLLLGEFDAEMKTTRTTLERVPFDKQGFKPHTKSMPLDKLAPHVAELAGFGATVLPSTGTTRQLVSISPSSLTPTSTG